MSGILEWAKPFLAPLYSWTAAAPPGSFLPLPEAVSLTLAWLVASLDGERQEGNRMRSCKKVCESHTLAFATDAKGEPNVVTIGGWCSLPDGTIPWFSLSITPEMAPFLFVWDQEKGYFDSSRRIATAEFLATLLAVKLWAGQGKATRAGVTMVGLTDNQGNGYIIKKWVTTKWPLAAFVMDLASFLDRSGIRVDVRWVAREYNAMADALTNEDFSLFEAASRIKVEWKDVEISVALKILEAQSKLSVDLDKLKSERTVQRKATGGLKRKAQGLEKWA